MRRDEAVQHLKRVAAERGGARRHSPYLFGSVARNQKRPDSDVDIFVEYDADRFSLFELAR